jgi:hypothetical protein
MEGDRLPRTTSSMATTKPNHHAAPAARMIEPATSAAGKATA